MMSYERRKTMKSIMISIKPKWVAKILNGEKTIEIRKTMPKCEYPIDVYIYCTKEEYLLRTNKGYIASKKGVAVGKDSEYTSAYSEDGMVVAKFTLNKVEEILIYWKGKYCEEPYYKTNSLSEVELLEKSCLLTFENICNYMATKGYAWHIDNLEISDSPKELGEFYNKPHIIFTRNGMLYGCTPLIKAPQSWCYVEV